MFNSGSSVFKNFPTVTKNILIINILMWLAQITLPRVGIDITNLLGLHYWGASDFNPVQLFTYMFLHATNDFSHLFFNMFSLLMFGPLLERTLGSKRYLIYYLTCGLGAGVIQELVQHITFVTELAQYSGVDTGRGIIPMAQYLNMQLTIGASGCVFGILLAFGMIFPNMPLYLMFIPIPIKAKWMVLGYGAIELLFGVTGAMNGVAHFAHLGGMLFGFILLMIWKKKGGIGGNGYY